MEGKSPCQSPLLPSRLRLVILSMVWLTGQITESPAKIDDLDKLDWMHEAITNPPVSRIDLKFPQSLTLTVRKPKGVTVKDAMDTIYKKFKHKTLEV